MRFLDLNRYSLLSFTATLVAIAYSSHKSLFHTPSSFLNLALLKSLEPFLKDVIPFTADLPFSSFSGSASFDTVLDDLILDGSQPQQQQQQQQQQQVTLAKDTVTFDQTKLPSKRPGLVDNNYEHSRLLGGAAGVGNGFRPSVFQAMLAERYLKFRTPSPAVLLQLQVILSYLQNEKLCVLVREQQQTPSYSYLFVCLFVHFFIFYLFCWGNRQRPFYPLFCCLLTILCPFSYVARSSLTWRSVWPSLRVDSFSGHFLEISV